MTDQLMNQLIEAIQTSPESRYRIAQQSGVAASQLSRLLNRKQSLGLETAVRLADYLGLEIIIRKKARTWRTK